MEAVLPKLHDMHAWDLTGALCAAAQIGIEDETFNTTWLEAVVPKLHGMHAWEITGALCVAAQIGIEDETFNTT